MDFAVITNMTNSAKNDTKTLARCGTEWETILPVHEIL